MPRPAAPPPILTPVLRELTIDDASTIVSEAHPAAERRHALSTELREAIRSGDAAQLLTAAKRMAGFEEETELS